MENVKMLGALVGDIVGSVYEFAPVKYTDFGPIAHFAG